MKLKILNWIAQSLKLPKAQIELFLNNQPQHGDFSSNIAMKLAAKLKKDPMTVAQDLKKKT